VQVGSKTLTLFWACVLAGICEFAGAVLLGRGVSDTIKSGIVKVDAFTGARHCPLRTAAMRMHAMARWRAPHDGTDAVHARFQCATH
jgi:phosphate/sulfate permease